jgi:hypothetical protein
MEVNAADVSFLRKQIINDIFRGLGPKAQGFPSKIMWPIIWPPAHEFSKLAARFDEFVEYYGNLCDAMRQILPRFVSGVNVSGAANVPNEGPLLIVSNHPGTFDELVIASNLQRKDLKIVAEGFPFLSNLPNTREHLIFINQNINERVFAIRDIIRRLEQGFSLLIFPSGSLEPDPAILPGAEDSLNNWSHSLDLILRKVPQTQVQVTIVSGVLSKSALNHPFSKLFKDEKQRQRVAEAIQIMQQLFSPGKYNLVPKLTFEKPFTLDEHYQYNRMESPIRDAITQKAKILLEYHSQI